MKPFPSAPGWTTIEPGQVLYGEIDLQEGDFFRVCVEQRGIDVALRLRDQQDRAVLEIDSPTGRFGPEELLGVAPARGQYRWTVEAHASEPAPGEVRLIEAMNRPATVGDRELVAADQEDHQGRALARAGAAGEAVEALQQALHTFADRSLTWRQAETLFSLGLAHASQGELSAAADYCDRAISLHRSAGHRHRLAHMLDYAGFFRLQSGELSRARASLEEAESLTEETGDGRSLAAVLAHLGSTHQALGSHEEAARLLADALARWRAAGGKAEREGAILVDLGWALLAGGKTKDAEKRFTEAVACAARTDAVELASMALRGAAEATSRQGDHELALAKIREAMAETGAASEPRQRMATLLTYGQVLRRKGDLADARGPFEEALALARRVGDRRSEAIVWLELGHASTQLGEAGRGLESCEKALSLFTEIGDASGRESALRRSGDARTALRAAVTAAELPTALALSAPATLPSGEAGPGSAVESQAGEPAFCDIEGPEGPKQPVNLTGTDLPGDGDGKRESSSPTRRGRGATPQAEWDRQNRAEKGLEVGEFFSFDQTPFGGLAEDPPDPLAPDLEPGSVGTLLLSANEIRDPARQDELKLCREYEEATEQQMRIRRARRELPSDVDPHDLSATGWGIVIARTEDPAVSHALRRLIEHREQQAGKRFKEIPYWPDDSGRTFLWGRNGESPGVLDPEVLPYYLLLVGGPEKIPFDVQYQLSINHAVGRLFFHDPADYSRYVDRLIQAENEGTGLPKRGIIVSVENGDRATALLASHLVAPLEKRLDGHADWEFQVWREDEARKESLARVLGGADTPGLLLVACHGERRLPEDPLQPELQGALLCQQEAASDGGKASRFHAGDLTDAADLKGQITFLFACYGAGTPLVDNFPFLTRDNQPISRPRPERLAPCPFVARLPQVLLRQGALAVVGHVDRGWTLSFAWAAQGVHETEAVRSLEDSLKRLLSGHRLGHSLRPLVRRYTALAAHLAEPAERRRYGRAVDPRTFAMQWVAHNDARNFVILGDPAVYLLGKRPEERGRRREDDRAHVRLEEAVLAAAGREALARGLSLQQWVNQVVREQAGEMEVERT